MLLKWTIWLCIYPGGFFHPYPNLAFLLEFPIWKTKNHNNDAINVFLNKNIEKTFIHLWEIFAIKDACKKLWWIQWVYIVMMKMKAKEKIFCKTKKGISYEEIAQLRCLMLIWSFLLILCSLQFMLCLPETCSIPLTFLLQSTKHTHRLWSLFKKEI